jgi:hypothetical protein
VQNRQSYKSKKNVQRIFKKLTRKQKSEGKEESLEELSFGAFSQSKKSSPAEAKEAEQNY